MISPAPIPHPPSIHPSIHPLIPPHTPPHPTPPPHKVDVSRGTFSATFYAHFTTERWAPPYPETDDIRTDNKLAERILQNAASFPTSSQVRKMERSNTTQQVRMKAKFYFSSQNHKFPFETQSLVIAIEDPKQVRRKDHGAEGTGGGGTGGHRWKRRWRYTIVSARTVCWMLTETLLCNAYTSLH